MSYDITFVYIDSNADPLTKAQIGSVVRSIETKALAATDADDERRKVLVADLLKLHPTLQMEPYDRGASHGCCIESTDDTCPLPDINVGVRSVFIALPNGLGPEGFQELTPLYNVLTNHGYVAWDHQTDTLWSPQKAAARFEKSRRKPWWRFW